MVVNATTGAIAQELQYDEFGNVLVDTNHGFQPFGFAGGLDDSDTGLVRFGARNYDPEIGRWLSKDPVYFGGGSKNLYSYVTNDPINKVDSTGRPEEDVRIAIGIASIYHPSVAGKEISYEYMNDSYGRTRWDIYGNPTLVLDRSFRNKLNEYDRQELIITAIHEAQHIEDGILKTNFDNVFGKPSATSDLTVYHDQINERAKEIGQNYKGNKCGGR